MRKTGLLVFCLIFLGALLSPLPISDAAQAYDWKIKKEETRKATAGYSDSMSYVVGSSIDFKISCPSEFFALEAVRVGYYDGDQGKRISQSQKTDCVNQSALDSKKWKTNIKIDTKAFPHGMYLFVIRDSDGYSSYMPIVLREKQALAKALFSVPTMTMQAYNTWTGADTYGGVNGFDSRLRIVDFRKPFDKGSGTGKYLRYVHPLIVYIEKLKLDVSYVADTDIHFDGSLLENRRVFITAGHDEYWTIQERENVINARLSGMNTIFFGANAGYWNTRLQKSKTDGSLSMAIYKSKEEDPNKRNPTIKFRDLGMPETDLTSLQYKCFPAKGNFVVKQPNSFVFKGLQDIESFNLDGLVGPEVDSLVSSSLDKGKLVNLGEARVRCGTRWYAPRYGRMNMVLSRAMSTSGGNFSTGTMGWVLNGLSAPESSDIGRFTRIVSKNVLEKAMQGTLG